jgi:hypothetical protein
VFNFKTNMIFPKVVYREAKKSVDGQSLIVDCEFQVLEDVTYGSVIVEIVNEQTGYLT